MHRKILSLAAALAVAITAALAALTYTQSQPTQAPAMVTITRATLDAELKSDKPMLVLFTSPSCATCSDLVTAFTAQAAKHPDWKFAQVNAAEINFQADATPIVSVFLPGVGLTYSKFYFAAPADMDAFMNQRADVATKTAAAVANLKAMNKQVEEKSAPYKVELDAVRAEFDKINKPFVDRLAAVYAAEKKAMAPFEKERKDIGARYDAAFKPFADQMTEVMKRRREAADRLYKEMHALEAEIRDALSKGTKLDDPLLKPKTDRIAAIRVEYQIMAKPLDEEMAKLEVQAEAARQPFRKQMSDVDARYDTAAVPFLIQRDIIRKEQQEALKDVHARAADISKRQAVALATLWQEVDKAKEALDELAYGDQ